MKACKSDFRKREEFRENVEPEEIEESDTDKSISISTGIKHKTDQKNQFTMTNKKTEPKKTSSSTWDQLSQ